MGLAEAKIFKNGQSQAVRLPKEFRMSGSSVFVKHMGNAVLLIPKDSVWDLMEEGLSEIDPEFSFSRDQGEEQVREQID